MPLPSLFFTYSMALTRWCAGRMQKLLLVTDITQPLLVVMQGRARNSRLASTHLNAPPELKEKM